MIQALKKLAILVGILLLAGYIGNLLLDNPYMHGLIRNVINEQLKEYTHLNVKFEAVSAKFLPPGLEVYGVEVKDAGGQDLLQVSHITANISYRALLFSRKQLFDIDINEPKVHLPLPPLDQLLRVEKFPDLMKDTGPPTWPPKAPLPFYRLAINNGQLSLHLNEKASDKELLDLLVSGLDVELIFKSWSQFSVALQTASTRLALQGAQLLQDSKISLKMSKTELGLRSDYFTIDSKELLSKGDLRLAFELAPGAQKYQTMRGLNLRLKTRIDRADLGILGRYLKVDKTDGDLSGKFDLQLQIPFDDRKVAWDIDAEGQTHAARLAGFLLHESKAEININDEGITFEKASVIKDGKEQVRGKGFLGFKKEGRLDFELEPEHVTMRDLLGTLQVENFDAFEASMAPSQLKLKGQIKPFFLDIDGKVILDDLTLPFVKKLAKKYEQAPHCELDAALHVTDKVFSIDKGDGFCAPRTENNGAQSPLAINGKIHYAKQEGMDLSIASKALNGSLLNHFVKLPIAGEAEADIKIAGPYDKLAVRGEISADKLNVTGFDLRNIDADFTLPIAENRFILKDLSAEVAPAGLLHIDEMTVGLAPELPFTLTMNASKIPETFIGNGLTKTLGKPSVAVGINSLKAQISGDLLKPFRYEGKAQLDLRELGFEGERLLSDFKGTFSGDKKGQHLRDSVVRLDRLDARLNVETEFDKAAVKAPVPAILQGLGLDDNDLVKIGFHTLNDNTEEFRQNKVDLSENDLAALPYAGSFFREQKIGGLIELDTDLQGPAGRLQGKLEGALQRPFLFNLPVSAFSFSGFLDGTKLQIPEFRHAGNSLVGRFNLDFGKPELPYDWYIYLKQFDARAVLGKFFADDPRNYAYLSAEWTMSGQLKNFWKSTGEIVFIDMRTKMYRNLGSRTTALEIASDQKVRVTISPEHWGFDQNRPLKLHGEFFDLELSAGDNRLPDKLDLHMQGSVKLDILKGFTNLTETARGELMLDGYLRGSLSHPEFSMRIQERKLDPFNVKDYNPIAIGLVNYGPALSSVSLDVEVQQDRIVVHRFRANKGREGTLEINGTLVFDPKAQDLSHLLIHLDRIELNRLQIPVLKSADAVVSGDLTLSGDKVPFNLSGNLKLDRFQSIGNFDLRKEIVASLYESKVYSSAGKVVQSPFLNLDVGLIAEHSILVKNKTIEATLSANLKVKGTDVQPLLLGQIIADSGTFNYRRAFRITQAVVSFDEPISPPNPRLDISGEAIINPYKVTIQVGGDLQQPKMSLTSDPPNRDDGTALTNLDIILLITTGKVSETANKTAEKASVNEIFSSFLVFTEEPLEKLFDLSGQTVIREVYVDSYLSEDQQRPITRVNVPINLFNTANAVVQLDEEANSKISFEYPLHEGITFTGSLEHRTNKKVDPNTSNIPQDTGFDLKFRFGFD